MSPDTLAAIHAECFDTAPRAWSAQEFAEILESYGVELTSSEQGFAVVRLVAGEAELLTIAVRPEARRLGVGRDLMVRAIAGAKAKGAVEMFLEVAQDNVAASALYERSGFTEVGIRKDYYAGPKGVKISARVMKLAL